MRYEDLAILYTPGEVLEPMRDVRSVFLEEVNLFSTARDTYKRDIISSLTGYTSGESDLSLREASWR